MEATLPDGRKIDFPDGTPQSIIDKYISKYHPPEPNVAERTIGHLSKGIGRALEMVDNFNQYSGMGVKEYPYQKKGVDIGEFFGENRFANQVKAYPEQTWYGSLAGGAVEFIPQLPIYTAGGGAAIRGAAAIPKVGKYAEMLLTKGSTPIREWGKSVVRGAVEGGVVGSTIGVKPGTDMSERLAKGAEESIGFGAAVGLLHPVLKGTGYIAKGIWRRLGKKATPENVEAELSKQAERNPEAAKDLEVIRQNRAQEVSEVDNDLLVIKGQGELELEPLPKETLDKFAALGYKEADLAGKPDSELINILEKGIVNDKTNEPGIPGGKRGGEAAKQGELEQVAGEAKVEAGGDVQALEGKAKTEEISKIKEAISSVEERIEQKTRTLNEELNKEVRDNDYIEKLQESIDTEVSRHRKLMSGKRELEGKTAPQEISDFLAGRERRKLGDLLATENEVANQGIADSLGIRYDGKTKMFGKDIYNFTFTTPSGREASFSVKLGKDIKEVYEKKVKEFGSDTVPVAAEKPTSEHNMIIADKRTKESTQRLMRMGYRPDEIKKMKESDAQKIFDDYARNEAEAERIVAEKKARGKEFIAKVEEKQAEKVDAPPVEKEVLAENLQKKLDEIDPEDLDSAADIIDNLRRLDDPMMNKILDELPKTEEEIELAARRDLIERRAKKLEAQKPVEAKPDAPKTREELDKFLAEKRRKRDPNASKKKKALQDEWEKKLREEGMEEGESIEVVFTDKNDAEMVRELDFEKGGSRTYDEIEDGVYLDSFGASRFQKIYEQASKYVKDKGGLVQLGKSVYLNGYKSFEGFVAKCKEVLGETWNSLRRYAREAYNAAKEWNERLGEVGAIRVHPAPFSKIIQKELASIADRYGIKDILDIFGGIGKIGKIKEYGYRGIVRANELEPMWGGIRTEVLQKKNGVDITTIGDSRTLNMPDSSVSAIFTSPTYGNAMGLRSASKTDSYQAFAGGKLSEGNTGGEVWGPEYEQLHREIYHEAARVVKPGGYFVLNMKDKPVSASTAKNNWIPKKGSTVIVENNVMKATDWHIKALQDEGFKVVERIKVDEAPIISRVHKLSRKYTVGYEDIVVLQKPRGGIRVGHGTGTYSLDFMGLQQIFEIGKKIVNSFRTQQNAASNRVISEVNGKKLTRKDDADFVEGSVGQILKNVKEFIRYRGMSPDFAIRNNPKVEPLVTNLHLASFDANFAASKRNEIVKIAHTMVPDKNEQLLIKPYLERGKWSKELEELNNDIANITKKTTLTNAEAKWLAKAPEHVKRLEKKIEEESKRVYPPHVVEAAEMIKSELAAVREKYKDFLRGQMKKNLNEDENAALAEILGGKSIDDVIAKYKEHIVKDKLGRRRVRAWLDEAVIRDIAKDYEKIDKWGLDDYITHYERGTFRIVSGNKLYAKAMSVEDAARKFEKLAELYPDKEFELDTKHDMEALAAGVSRRQYNQIVNNLQKGIKEAIEDINSALARRAAEKGLENRFFIKPPRQFSPFTLDRHEFLEGEENVFDILYTYFYSMEKKMALDPVIDDIRRAISRTDVVGTEQYKARDGSIKEREIKRPYLKDEEVRFLERYVEDVKGRLYKGDEYVDSLFKNSANQRLYSRAVQTTRELQANLKLGYAPIKGFINGASALGHVWTKVGTKYTKDGAEFLRTPEGKAFIKDMEPYLGINIVESATGELTTRGFFEKYGVLKAPKTKAGKMAHAAIEPLGAFQYPELPVRKLTLAANYLMAKSEGMSEEAARLTAIKANWFQQFTYDMASLPELMRSPTGRLITQFKPYLLKELEFISTLRGGEIARYIAMQVTLGGPRGLVMVAKSLPILGAWYGWTELEDWANKNYPVASRGIGGVMGVDITAAATFQLPTRWQDWLGPTLSDLSSLYTNVFQPSVANTVNYLTGGGIENQVDVEGMRALTTTVPIMRHWANVFEQVVDRDGWVKDDRNRRLWHIDNMASFVTKSMAGAEPIELNRLRVAEYNLTQKDMKLTEQKTLLIDDILDAIAKGAPIDEDMLERMVKLGVKPSTLRRAARFRVLDPKMRRVLMTEIIRRPEILEMYPDAEDLE